MPSRDITQLVSLCRDVIWRVDPVGVAEFRDDAESEYDDVANQVGGRIFRGESIAQIETWLAREFAENWGLPHPDDVARQIADGLGAVAREWPPPHPTSRGRAT